MARIVSDNGLQSLDTADGVGYYYIYEMDCGCEIRMNQREMFSISRSSGVDLRTRLARVAETHDCEIVVHQAPERHRREIRQRREREAAEPPIRFMGMNVLPHPNINDWIVGLQQEVLGTFDVRPGAARPAPVPQTAPEQAVRRAAERLQGLQVSGVVVDEQIGFKAPELAKPPEKKPDPPRALTRWELLELD